MAKPALAGPEITETAINSGESYRVKFSYGVFSIAPKVTQGGVYYYAVKRHQGQLFKVYVGKCGEVTKELLHQATMILLNKATATTGKWYVRDNRARGRRS